MELIHDEWPLLETSNLIVSFRYGVELLLLFDILKRPFSSSQQTFLSGF